MQRKSDRSKVEPIEPERRQIPRQIADTIYHCLHEVWLSLPANKTTEGGGISKKRPRPR
jgi:hypothetical protein